jgi:hypothetical protein
MLEVMIHEGWACLATRRGALVLLASFAASLGCGSHVISFKFDEQELMARWNAAADGVTVTGFGDFKWTAVDRFPHPTFKGGSVEAYNQFALVLVAFYEQGDNFDYLARNHLFHHPLSSNGLVTSFADLTALLLASDLGLPAETRQKLVDFDARIQAVALKSTEKLRWADRLSDKYRCDSNSASRTSCGAARV